MCSSLLSRIENVSWCADVVWKDDQVHVQIRGGSASISVRKTEMGQENELGMVVEMSARYHATRFCELMRALGSDSTCREFER